MQVLPDLPQGYGMHEQIRDARCDKGYTVDVPNDRGFQLDVASSCTGTTQ